ncbi:MAG: ATP-binding cassette domain-containing protein [Lachnospiraceae bacterium]|nr:ATP-binding cassette domain-containing protein [Lachnospiraceae bacterium]
MTFLPGYSGLKNLDYLASIRGKVQEDEIRKYMELAGLNPDDKKHVGNYSLGMRQRLGIAQALMENPDILILDEPMNALDHNGVEEMRAVLLQMKEQGKLVLIASHFRDDIDILCDEVYGMDAGIMEKIR